MPTYSLLFGGHLRSLRLNEGLTQEEVALVASALAGGDFIEREYT